jgi:hypothetical protein
MTITTSSLARRLPGISGPRLAVLTAWTCLAALPRLARADAPIVPAAAPAYTQEASVGYSFSSSGDLDRGSKVGTVKVSHYDLGDRFEFPVTGDLKLGAGVFWTDNQLSLTGAVPLPTRLATVGLQLGATEDLAAPIGPGWTASVFVRPGFFQGGSGFSSRSFDVPGALLAGYQARPTLSVNFGLAVDVRSQYEVLPAAGVRWKFAPDWTVSVGFPETGIAYRVSSALSLNAGARFQGGSYYVPTALAPGLGNTRLEYHEVRVGGGAEARLPGNFRVRLDGGAVVNRRFNYYDRNYSLDGKQAFYLSLGLAARF